MSEFPKSLWSDLAQYFMLAIEVLVMYVAPAIAFMRIVGLAYPDDLNLQSFLNNGTWIEVLTVVVVAVVVGIILSQIGDFLLAVIDKKVNFAKKADDSVFEEFSGAHLGLFDISKFIKSLTPEQFRELNDKSPKDKDAFWDGVFDSVVAFAKTETKRRLNLGTTLIPEVIALSAPEYRRELRTFTSEADCVFGFCRSMLPVLIAVGVILALNANGIPQMLIRVFSAFIAVYLWVRTAIASYGVLRAKQLALLIGLSYRAKLDAEGL